ncbi:MAG: sulfatase family protein [Roseibacillus sp.]
MRNTPSRLGLLLAFLSISFASLQAAETPPNIVYILADDMGYGDVQCYNPERGKIPTPHMDRLAEEGMRFTDAHTTSSVCTPTRYGILTGRYNWRTRLQRSVLCGYSPPLINPERATVASFLKQHDYTTAIVGKWHLGLGLPSTDGGTLKKGAKTAENIDWSGRIAGGPIDLGFDYFYGISASLDMPPYLYILNDRFVGEGTATKAFHRKGAAEPDFEAVDVLPEIGNKSAEYIAKQKADKPFFLYVPLASPHTPILPSEEWKGKTGLGDYADFQMQTDHVIGQIADAIDEHGFGENTLFIVTSDNGCSPRADFKDLESKGHFASAQFRGAKADLWDGGHRVPFIVRWPAQVKANTVSDQLICQSDLMATCADILGETLVPEAGPDSESMLPALKGETVVSKRNGMIHHSISGSFAYRHGKWKLLLTKGSGGWSKAPNVKGSPEGQLYDMEADPGETKNLYEEKPEVVAKLIAFLEKDIAEGRSTPGPKQCNDAEIVMWKGKKK